MDRTTEELDAGEWVVVGAVQGIYSWHLITALCNKL